MKFTSTTNNKRDLQKQGPRSSSVSPAVYRDRPGVPHAPQKKMRRSVRKRGKDTSTCESNGSESQPKKAKKSRQKGKRLGALSIDCAFDYPHQVIFLTQQFIYGSLCVTERRRGRQAKTMCTAAWDGEHFCRCSSSLFLQNFTTVTCIACPRGGWILSPGMSLAEQTA